MCGNLNSIILGGSTEKHVGVICLCATKILRAKKQMGGGNSIVVPLESLYMQALELLRRVRDLGIRCKLQHIHREYNATADALAKHALDVGEIMQNWMM